MTLTLTSTAFADHGEIPRRHTCEGEDRSPPLVWSGIPAGTRSLVLIVDDPDAPDPAAPKMTWVHWLLYNLPADCTGLPEGVGKLPAGTMEGINDWHRTGYSGPCPPHRLPPLLPQALRSRRRPPGPSPPEQGDARTGHGRPRDRASTAPRHLPEASLMDAARQSRLP